MKKIMLLAIAFIMCISSVPSTAANIIEYHHDEDINMSITPGSGKCGDSVSWSLTPDGTLTISGKGKMYEYTETDTLPWFENNDNQAILNVKVEEGVESICYGAFFKTSVVSLVLPDSITEIGKMSVSSCPNLEYVVLSDNIEELPESALYYDSALTYVHMPKNLKTIGFGVFSWDDKIENIVIPENVTVIEEGAFSECCSLKKVVIPVGVTTLDRAVFCLNNSMTELYLPPSLKTIGKTTFSGCANIDKIILPDGLTQIGESAFAWADEERNTSSKQIIYVPKSVTEFGKFAILGGGIEIHGFVGSEAEKYANENKIPFVAVTESMYSVDEYNNALNGQIETAPEIPVAAAQPSVNEETLDVTSENGVINIAVGGKTVDFSDAQPFIDENGRTQIPIRAVAEALGAKVDWDEAERMATITRDNKVITIAIGNTKLQIGDEAITMDTAAQIINERTYIPIRFVGEALGMTVNWIEE